MIIHRTDALPSKTTRHTVARRKATQAKAGGTPDLSTLRLSLLRFLDSKLPGHSLLTY